MRPRRGAVLRGKLQRQGAQAALCVDPRPGLAQRKGRAHLHRAVGARRGQHDLRARPSLSAWSYCCYAHMPNLPWKVKLGVTTNANILVDSRHLPAGAVRPAAHVMALSADILSETATTAKFAQWWATVRSDGASCVARGYSTGQTPHWTPPAAARQVSWSAKRFKERNLHSAVPAWLAAICFFVVPVTIRHSAVGGYILIIIAAAGVWAPHGPMWSWCAFTVQHCTQTPLICCIHLPCRVINCMLVRTFCRNCAASPCLPAVTEHRPCAHCLP